MPRAPNLPRGSLLADPAHPSPPPLPVRLDPMPGEWWTGYLARVAARWSTGRAALVRPISRTWAWNQMWVDMTANRGIHMNRDTIDSTAVRFNLSPEEVEAMQLTHHLGPTLRENHPGIGWFDPTLPMEVGGSDAHKLAWFAALQRRRRCPQCRTEHPAVERLEWRTGWITCCTRHGLLLDETAASREPALLGPAPPALLAVTTHLESIRAGAAQFESVSPTQGFLELQVATRVLADHRAGRSARPIAPIPSAETARVLVAAYAAVQTPVAEWPREALPLLEAASGRRVLRVLGRLGAVDPRGLAGALTRNAQAPLARDSL